VPLWRRIAIVGLLAFVVVVAVWAFRPWTSAVSLPASDSKNPNSDSQAVFWCGAPFGSDGITPSNSLARVETALPHQPCTTRTARRSLAIAGLVVGGLGVVGLLAVKRPQPDVKPATGEA